MLSIPDADGSLKSKQRVSLVVVIGSSAPAFAQWHDPPQDGNGQPHDAGHNPGDQVVYHVGDHEVRQSRRVRKIDFSQLDALSTSADQELRETEDGLVAFVEQQAKRDALYGESRDELKQKYEFGRMSGVA